MRIKEIFNPYWTELDRQRSRQMHHIKDDDTDDSEEDAEEDIKEEDDKSVS